MKKTKIFCVFLVLTILSGCFAQSNIDSSTEVDNRTLIVELGSIDVEGLLHTDASLPTKSNHNFISNSLTKALNDYKGQDVWFRLLAHFQNFSEYAEAERKYADVLAEELQYAEQIGVMNIEKADATTPSLGFYKEYLYCMEATADMIEQLLVRKCAQLTLGLPKREGDYNDKIFDTVTYKLERMGENDTTEIVAVSIYDCFDRYARIQDCANERHNSKYYKRMLGTEDKSSSEIEELLEKHVSDIIDRNGFTEKRIVSDNLPQIGFGKISNPRDATLSKVIAGFNAALTKAEILKLAEDEEIKVIYLAQQ